MLSRKAAFATLALTIATLTGLAVACPAQTLTGRVAQSGKFTINGVTSITSNSSVARISYPSGGYVLSGMMNISGISGDLAGTIYAAVSSVKPASVTVPGKIGLFKHASVTTVPFWYTDYTHYIVGNASTIKKYWAVAQIEMTQCGYGWLGYKVWAVGDPIATGNGVPAGTILANTTGHAGFLTFAPSGISQTPLMYPGSTLVNWATL
jgi:hypothetical protein